MFSIQNLYVYNPQQYIEMANNINKFFELYDSTFIDKSSSYINYEFMVQCKRDSLNSLQSMTLKIPSDLRVRKFLNDAVDTLDNILTQRLDHISFLVDEYTHINGYDINTKIINYGPKASNEYEDIFKPYSYNIY